MKVFALFLTFPLTGHTEVRTYATAFLRSLDIISLASQPVVLRDVDYTSDDKMRMAKAESVRPVHV